MSWVQYIHYLLMQANVWRRFLILTLWEVFRSPQRSWISADLPISKYKSIFFILPFRLMVRMLQVAAEPRGLCKPGIPFCLRVAETPGVGLSVCPSQSHGCIPQVFPCAGRAGGGAAAPVCVRAHPGMPKPRTASADNPALLLPSPGPVWGSLQTPHTLSLRFTSSATFTDRRTSAWPSSRLIRLPGPAPS